LKEMAKPDSWPLSGAAILPTTAAHLLFVTGSIQ